MCHGIICAEEGSGKTQTIVSIGDKGRAQLARAEPSLYSMGIADTYKARVTFNQVREASHSEFTVNAFSFDEHCAIIPQASTIVDEVLKTYNPDSVRVVFNKFYSAVSFKPTFSTILAPEVQPGSVFSRG